MKEYGQVALILVIIAIATALLGSFAHHLVMSGVIMGMFTVAGVAILWIKAPPIIKEMLAKGDFIVDVALTITVFIAFGITTTGLVGAGITCLFLSLLLKVNKIYQIKSKER